MATEFQRRKIGLASSRLDLDGDGRITREEFRTHWYEFWAGDDASAPGRLLSGPGTFL
ncbi:hypothetical protein ABZ766_15165 [Streptomyces sp. NPDC006670]|uniref:hypothetical protein n=1 Tax=Streptomyces sp. NPDC006670 TaxID=3154476 RepID=UPI0033CDB816